TPRSSTPRQRTYRTEGQPSALTVASDIAVGSPTPFASASASQAASVSSGFEESGGVKTEPRLARPVRRRPGGVPPVYSMGWAGRGHESDEHRDRRGSYRDAPRTVPRP